MGGKGIGERRRRDEIPVVRGEMRGGNIRTSFVARRDEWHFAGWSQGGGWSIEACPELLWIGPTEEDEHVLPGPPPMGAASDCEEDAQEPGQQGHQPLALSWVPLTTGDP